MEPLVDSYREAAKAESARRGHLVIEDMRSLVFSARLHEVPCICTPFWDPLHTARPLRPPRLEASVKGRNKPEKPLTHSLNLPLSPGTREASRGREGRARSARPSARQRPSRVSGGRIAMYPGQRQSAPQDSRSGAWGGRAGQVLRSCKGRVAQVIAGMANNSQLKQLTWPSSRLRGRAADVKTVWFGGWRRHSG